MKRNSLYFLLVFFCILFVPFLEGITKGLILHDSFLKEKVVFSYDYENLKKEYEDLLSQSGFIYHDPSFIVSKVLYKDPYSFYDQMTILKGSDDGIEVGDIVVNDKGYVGMIKKTKTSSSVVELLLSPQTQISVSINHSYGILNVKDHSLIVHHVTSKEPIEEGSIVYTSKYSKIPYEIPIGIVKEVKIDSKEQVLVVIPLVDFDSLSYVSIRKGSTL